MNTWTIVYRVKDRERSWLHNVVWYWVIWLCFLQRGIWGFEAGSGSSPGHANHETERFPHCSWNREPDCCHSYSHDHLCQCHGKVCIWSIIQYFPTYFKTDSRGEELLWWWWDISQVFTEERWLQVMISVWRRMLSISVQIRDEQLSVWSNIWEDSGGVQGWTRLYIKHIIFVASVLLTFTRLEERLPRRHLMIVEETLSTVWTTSSTEWVQTKLLQYLIFNSIDDISVTSPPLSFSGIDCKNPGR